MKEKLKLIDASTLKIIAIISMILDHTNKAILIPRLDSNILMIISDIFMVLGRFAFPIFAFLLVEGFFHTKSKIKYLINLVIFACVSEIPFNLFTTVEFINIAFQNVLFTFSLALLTIWLIDTLRNKFKWWIVLAIPIILICSFLSEYLAFDYGYYGILVPFIFYLFHDKLLIATLLGFIVMIKEYWSFPSFILLNFYNGKRALKIKWLFYIIYPLHLLILGTIRLVSGL